MEKNCFGHYVYESIECMTCQCQSECQHYISQQKAKAKVERYPECTGCCDLNGCKVCPRGCIGSALECDDDYYCKCDFQCKIAAFNKFKMAGKIRIARDVKYAVGSSYKHITLNAGQEFEYAIEDGYFYIRTENNLLPYRIFNVEDGVWRPYLILPPAAIEKVQWLVK